MRQIETQAISEAKRKRRQFILSALMIIILLGSTAGYAVSLISSNSSQLGATSGKPFFDGVYWIVPYGSTQIQVRSSPTEVGSVPVTESLDRTLYQGKAVYVIAEDPSIKQQLMGVLSMVSPRVQEACYGSCNRTDVPEKDCTEPLVIWKESATRRIYTNASCVFIEGDYVASDAFVYRMAGQL